MFVLIGFTSNAQELSTPINVSNQAGTERPPIMHVGNDGTIFITWIRPDITGGVIFISHSTDGGRTFSHPKQATQNSKISPDFQRGGEFALDTKNRIHMVWVETRVNKQQDVWYSRSTDMGETWTEPKAVTDDSSKYTQDFISIACDSSDRVYVSFLDLREKKQGTSTTEQLYLTISTDGGDSWGPNKRITHYTSGIGGTCECCKQDIAVSPDGDVYVGYRSNINNQRDMHVVRSTDGGMTFEPPILIQTSPWMISACPVSGPNVALDKNENLHVVWRDARDAVGAPKIYYARLDKGSSETPGNFLLSGDALQPDWADVDAYGDGSNVVIAYQTFDKGLQYVLISDNLSEPMRMLADTSDTKKVLAQVAFANNGARYIAWTDDRNDNGDVFFVRDTAPLPTLAVKHIEGTTTSVIPTIVKVGEKIALENAFSIVLSDISGREITRLKASEFVIPNVAAGVYFVKITTDKDTQISKTIVVK